MLLPAISLTLVTPVVAHITRCSFPRRTAHLGCTGSTLLSYYLWEPALRDATQARIPIEFCRGPAASFNARTCTGLPTCWRRKSIGWHLLVRSSWDLDDPGNVVSLFTHLAAGNPRFWDVPDESRFVCINAKVQLICRSSPEPTGIPRIWSTVCHCCRQSTNLFTGMQDRELYPMREVWEIRMLAERHYFHKAR